MKRFHVHINVEAIDSAIDFYSTLFGERPSVVKHDYAKWMLEDPRVNFAISKSEIKNGVNHLGLQVDEKAELNVLASRLTLAGEKTFDQTETTCCYAKSDKSWVMDPAGVRWETFYTFGEATTYGEDAAELAMAEAPAVRSVPQTACGTQTGCC